jgi:hypothetical protein
MKRLVMTAALATGMAGNLAHADKLRATYRWTDPSKIGTTWVKPTANVSHVIYLNNCQPGGCTLHAGYDDSLTDTSSVPNSTASVSAYQGTSAQWNQIVQCVQQTYAPFNVQIVTTRPSSGDYHEAIVAGHAADVGEGQGVLGVSPFTCGYIPNSISFTFANELPNDVYQLCWTVAQETAHSWGLDHKYDDRDPMTYLDTGPQWKQYQNQAGACGEYSSRNCNCTYDTTGSAQENSYALIMATFGPSGPDPTPPVVKITSPTNGANVMAGFAVTANVTDNVGVQKADLLIDGSLVGTLNSDPYTWNSPANLGQGSHHIQVNGYDLMNNMATDAIDVTIGHACTMASDCSTAGDVCVDGHCVAGPGQQGGLGTTCTKNADCSSGQCGDDGAGNKYCVEGCNPAKNECPSGFSCTSTGATTGVCWPGGDNANGNGGGGCNSNGSGGVTVMFLALGAMLITRKRRR